MRTSVLWNAVLAVLLGGTPADAWETLEFQNHRAEPCTLAANWLPYPTTFVVLEQGGREIARATYPAGRGGGGATVPAQGSLRIHQEGCEYYWRAGFLVFRGQASEADCEVSTGRTPRSRRDGFGWTSWQRQIAGSGTEMRRSSCATRLRYRDARPRP